MLMADNKYVRLCRGIQDKGILVKQSEVLDRADADHEWYTSVFSYNQSQYEQFKKTGTVSGIKDVVTSKIWFDLDNSENPESSRKDSVEIINRLKNYKIKEKNIEVYFSGNKGIHILVNLTRELTPKQVGNICKFIGKGVSTLDLSVYNASRILRVPGTKHGKSGLYKYPLTVKQIQTLSIDQIKQLASSINNINTEFDWGTEDLPQEVLTVTNEPEVVQPAPTNFVEYNKLDRPKHWNEYKWALLNAVSLKPDERHQALMVLAATCKGLGYPQDITRAMLSTFDEKFQYNTGKGPVEDLEDNILSSVYSDAWSGGSYSYKNNIWLQQYCERIGLTPDATKEIKIKKIEDIYKEFEDFSVNFEKNILKTGVKELDDNILFLTSTHNGILGQPGSGKTSFVLQWLKTLSKQGINSFFYSLDMAEEIIFAKLIQSVKGYSFEKSVKLFRENKEEFDIIYEQIKEEYKNVEFVFTSGTSTDSIREDIKNYEKETGNKVKLLIVDYLECLQGPYSDSTANSGFISQQLKDVARDLKVCSVILLQTQKITGNGDVSEPLMSMKQIKGSSVIEQSSSVLLTLWREGYSPDFQEQDNFISLCCVKNRFGKLWKEDFNWVGSRGQINSISDEGRYLIKELRSDKKELKINKANETKTGWD